MAEIKTPVGDGNQWTQPVSSDAVREARCGKFVVVLTPTRPVPLDWFPELVGTPTLCLASAGGQQAPLLAAAGADVVVFDNSPRQLQQDQLDEQHVQALIDAGKPLEFGHTLEDQIGGQLQAGLILTGLSEDRYSPADKDPLIQYIASFIATRAIKL